MAAAARTNIVTSETENSYSSRLKFILIGVHVANQFQVYDLCIGKIREMSRCLTQELRLQFLLFWKIDSNFYVQDSNFIDERAE